MNNDINAIKCNNCGQVIYLWKVYAHSNTCCFPIKETTKKIDINRVDERISDVRTNSNSIYMKVDIKFKGYQRYKLPSFAYVDTGANMCIAKKYTLPEDLWKRAKINISVISASQHVIALDYAIENLKILISGNEFIIPVIYQCDTQSSNILIGNKFMQEYLPFS